MPLREPDHNLGGNGTTFVIISLTGGSGAILKLVLGQQDAKRGTVRVVFGIQKPRLVEECDGLRVVLVFKGRPTEPEVRLRGGGGVRVTPEQLLKSCCHLGVFLELAQSEGFLKEGDFDLLTELEAGDDLLEVGERLGVGLGFLPSETSL